MPPITWSYAENRLGDLFDLVDPAFKAVTKLPSKLTEREAGWAMPETLYSYHRGFFLKDVPLELRYRAARELFVVRYDGALRAFDFSGRRSVIKSAPPQDCINIVDYQFRPWWAEGK